MIVKSEQRCFGGVQGFYEHESTQGPMRFGVFMPPAPTPPVVYFLAGLECNEQTFAIKAGAQRVAAELGLALVTADTSPRGLRFSGDDASWDYGQSASFYVDGAHYRMRNYVVEELRSAVEGAFVVRKDTRGIFGHSMGGHGALTIGLTFPSVYASVTALAPICAPSQVPWGSKAFTGYLGAERAAWCAYDATELVRIGLQAASPIRIDQGSSDKFLSTQLLPDVFARVCAEHGQALSLHMHEGYDHSYYFIASVIEVQLRHHAAILLG